MTRRDPTDTTDSPTAEARSGSAAGQDRRGRNLLFVPADVRLGVVAATLSLFGLLLAWSIVTPALRGPDEPAHVSATSRLVRTGTWEPRDKASMDPAVLVANHSVGFDGKVWWAENPPLGLPGEDQGPAAPSLETLRDTLGATQPPSPDPAAAQPPGYYAVLALPWTVLALDQQSPSEAVLTLRMWSLLILVPVPWLVASCAVSMGLKPHAVVAAAFVPSAWIQFVHVGAVVNTGALVVLTTSLVVALLVPVILQGDVGRLRAFLVGVATCLGVLAKAFALGLVPIVIFAYLAAMRRSGRRASVRALLWAVVAMVPGVVWWLLNLNRLFGLDPASGAFGESAAPNGFAFSLWNWSTRALADLSGSFWANLGWLNTPLPSSLHFAASALFLVLLAAGIWRFRGSPALLAVLTATWAVPLAMIAVWSVRFYERNGFVDGMQGRYLHAGVVAFSVLAVASLESVRGVLRIVPFAAIALGVGGLVFGLRSFWDPPSFGTAVSWWPAGVALLGAAGLALASSLIILSIAPAAGFGGPQRGREPDAIQVASR